MIDISENWTYIPGWAIEDYGLKGAELIVYSVIYSFSQRGKSGEKNGNFTGSANYLAKWAGCSRSYICGVLKKLVKRGLLEKSYVTEGEQKYIVYRALRPDVNKVNPVNKVNTPCSQSEHPPVNKVNTPCSQSEHNNKDYIYREIEKNIDISNKYQNLANYWNAQIAKGSTPKIRSLTDTRKKHLKSLLKTYSESDVLEVFDKVRQSDWLSGRAGKWQATFDWVIKPSNFIKVLEGNFDNRSKDGDAMRDGLLAFMEG